MKKPAPEMARALTVFKIFRNPKSFKQEEINKNHIISFHSLDFKTQSGYGTVTPTGIAASLNYLSSSSTLS